MSGVTVEDVRDRLRYEAETGDLFWTMTQRAGTKAGTKTEKGYLRLEVRGIGLYAHRAAWMIVYGEIPDGQVDHINGDKSDNRIANLRVVDNAQNQQNRRAPARNNKSGFLGVVQVGKKYAAHIWVNGRQKYIGTYEGKEMAHKHYLAAKAQLHAGYVS